MAVSLVKSQSHSFFGENRWTKTALGVSTIGLGAVAGEWLVPSATSMFKPIISLYVLPAALPHLLFFSTPERNRNAMIKKIGVGSFVAYGLTGALALSDWALSSKSLKAELVGSAFMFTTVFTMSALLCCLDNWKKIHPSQVAV